MSCKIIKIQLSRAELNAPPPNCGGVVKQRRPSPRPVQRHGGPTGEVQGHHRSPHSRPWWEWSTRGLVTGSNRNWNGSERQKLQNANVVRCSLVLAAPMGQQSTSTMHQSAGREKGI